MRQLETAVKRAHEDCARAERTAAEARTPVPSAGTESQDNGDPAEDAATPEAEVEYRDDEDPTEPAAA